MQNCELRKSTNCERKVPNNKVKFMNTKICCKYCYYLIKRQNKSKVYQDGKRTI